MTCVPHINRTISGCRGWNHIGLTQEARWHQFCHLSWTATDLVTICYWKWPFIVFIVDFPMKNGHRNSWFPPIGWFPYVGLPGRVCLSTCWIIHYTTVPTKGMWFFIVGKPTITSSWFHRCIACHCFFPITITILRIAFSATRPPHSLLLRRLPVILTGVKC